MRMFVTAADLVPHVGQDLGVSDWLTVDQAMIDAFADVTGDRQWIHVDPARAARDLPGGRTIAHGLLILSLITAMRLYGVQRMRSALNYGFDKVRFTASVSSGSRVRHRLTLSACDPIPGGYRIVNHSVVEREGSERPALVADQIAHIYDPA